MIDPVLALPVLLVGACVGSFLNVVIWRLPRQESLVHPGSHCPRCGTPLSWAEKMPLLSWLLQRARCRHCHTAISCRYPLVECLAAVLWLAAAAARPESLGAAPPWWLVMVAGWLLVSITIPLALIDLDHLWLPEGLCRLGVAAGLAVTLMAAAHQGWSDGRQLVLSHLLAAGMGLLAMEGLAALAERLLGRPAMGLGDAKLAALIGAWLGPAGLLVSLGLAVTSGAAVGSLARLSGRLGAGQPMPFGPFLVAGCLFCWFQGSSPWLERLGL
jgi:leader peptidase (prepilin peptidase)/N-methyltransferase